MYELDPADSYAQSCPSHIYIARTLKTGLGLFASREIKRGQILFRFNGQIVVFEQANPMSLQLSDDMFLRSEGKFDDLVNHSCDPNGVMVFDGLRVLLKASRPIYPGEEITFNYNTTEWDLAEQSRVFKTPCAFHCSCGSYKCNGEIIGFKHLPVNEKVRISPYISPFLRFKLMSELWQRSLTQPDSVAALRPVLPAWATKENAPFAVNHKQVSWFKPHVI